jgi:hypothetical protein
VPSLPLVGRISWFLGARSADGGGGTGSAALAAYEAAAGAGDRGEDGGGYGRRKSTDGNRCEKGVAGYGHGTF